MHQLNKTRLLESERKALITSPHLALDHTVWKPEPVLLPFLDTFWIWKSIKRIFAVIERITAQNKHLFKPTNFWQACPSESQKIEETPCSGAEQGIASSSSSWWSGLQFSYSMSQLSLSCAKYNSSMSILRSSARSCGNQWNFQLESRNTGCNNKGGVSTNPVSSAAVAYLMHIL